MLSTLVTTKPRNIMAPSGAFAVVGYSLTRWRASFPSPVNHQTKSVKPFRCFKLDL